MEAIKSLREPIVCVLGHVDHGKTTLLDDIRGTSIAEKEAGRITQKIGATEISYNILEREIKTAFKNIPIKIPGLLFIDTPGHVAFSNMRSLGGALADIAILVIDVNEGLKPQTIESIDILKKFKTPFIIAANKIDAVPYFVNTSNTSFANAIKMQRREYIEELDNRIYKLISDLYTYGINADRYDRISDFSKTFAIVPVSAKLKIGIADILMVLSGLAQKFLENEIRLTYEKTLGTVIEVKIEESIGITLDTILYQGMLKRGDTIAVNTSNGPARTRVKAILVNSNRGLKESEKVVAAAGIRVLITDKIPVIAGTSMIKIDENTSEDEAFKTIINESKPNIKISEHGVTVKAEALGSLEAIAYELEQASINIRSAEIGDITKHDVTDVSTLNDPLDRIIIGFNVSVLDDAVQEAASSDIGIITGNVIYSLVDDAQKWLAKRKHDLEEQRKSNIPVPSKIVIMPEYIFRAAKPVIVGIKVISGRVKVGDTLIDDNNKYAGTIKSLRDGDVSRQFVDAPAEVSCAIDGVVLNRHIFPGETLYVDIPENVAKQLRSEKLDDNIMKTLDEITKIKRKINQFWGF
ncbi:translation initiation factor IF-2 [Picrophilus oshimae]|uniref:Probable translation initiation factor IF-2 n=1 Tax=Picrophilus torridus (strain ATCC 700027 / DSM 9790 / JCM 10055 / NBRC 100828 / KAW 2/3) TaxID=1122961 RepID=Q6KZI3_PICTO|nr:translation initiation factor IF-2 [Picrophilus oshimae]AAT43869.1 protein translation initiation factor 5B [Picrophilus oshimae DSM 9789]